MDNLFESEAVIEAETPFPDVIPVSFGHFPVIEEENDHQRYVESIKLFDQIMAATNTTEASSLLSKIPEKQLGLVLRHACHYGKNIVVSAVLSSRKYVNVSILKDCFVQTVKFNHLSAVKIMLQDERVDPSADNNIALFWAVKYRYEPIIDSLLADKRVLNNVNSDLLSPAASTNNSPFVKRLLAFPNVDPSYRENEALVDAVRFRSIETVKILLNDRRVDVHAKNDLALRCANFNCQKEMIDLLKKN